ncbi:MAG: helix-turn-helix domain-containing protein, partial [Pigmentiphaga sp.]
MSTTPDAKVRRPRSRAHKQKVIERSTNGDSAESDALGVQAFERGLAVIRAFVNQDRPLTISDVAEITRLSRATVRRLLGSLVRLHYARTDGQSFQLTPTILELGYAYLSSN